MSQLLEFEGTWEELAMREPEFRGKKLKLTVLETAEVQETALQYKPSSYCAGVAEIAVGRT